MGTPPGTEAGRGAEAGRGTEARRGAEARYVIWRPRSLNWWIALLFMIGSAHFVFGSVLILAGSESAYLIDLIYFVGSLFFTSAGYSQYHQALNARAPSSAGGLAVPRGYRKVYFALRPKSADFWATFPQFVGTMAFNVSTFMAFVNLRWLGYDILVWSPDYAGSVLFLISGTAAMLQVCPRFWCRPRGRLPWWIAVINLMGCIAFMISAVAAFVRPHPLFGNLVIWATIFTLVGAVCFLLGAYLMWPQMARGSERG